MALGFEDFKSSGNVSGDADPKNRHGFKGEPAGNFLGICDVIQRTRQTAAPRYAGCHQVYENIEARGNV
jgi:hypothetical protein